jgi:hypothetical protein
VRDHEQNRTCFGKENLKDIEKRKARRTTFAKALSIGLVVGVLVLLAARPWPPSFYDAREQASMQNGHAQSVVASKPTAVSRRAAGVRIIEPERTPADDRREASSRAGTAPFEA